MRDMVRTIMRVLVMHCAQSLGFIADFHAVSRRENSCMQGVMLFCVALSGI